MCMHTLCSGTAVFVRVSIEVTTPFITRSPVFPQPPPSSPPSSPPSFAPSRPRRYILVDGAQVVDNGGNHGPRTRSSTSRLDRGRYNITAVYYNWGGSSTFKVEYSVAPVRTTVSSPVRIVSREVLGTPRVTALVPATFRDVTDLAVGGGAANYACEAKEEHALKCTRLHMVLREEQCGTMPQSCRKAMNPAVGFIMI